MKNIQVLQGLNFYSEISTIKILFKKTITKSDEVIKLVKNIQELHPVFLDSYDIKENTLYIESKLTFLWRELAETLLKLSDNKMTYKEAEDYAISEVIKDRIATMSIIPLLFAAEKQNEEITPTALLEERVKYSKGINRLYTIGAGRNSQIINFASSSKDSKIAKEIQRDKWSSNLMMERLGLPTARWEILDSAEQIEDIWDKYEKPVVIKPTGLTAGSGVSTGIDTIQKAKNAYQIAKEPTKKHIGKTWQQKIMIQEQVPGEDYRLLVIDGKLEVVTKRIPAFIIGDGKSTIKELIEETNRDPRRDTSKPTHILKPIKIDPPLLRLLDEKGLTLESIPKKDEKITVRKVASMSQGGITEDFTDQVGPEIKYIVESIANSIHAFVIGADILCKDISKPLTKDNGGIIEINTKPEAYLNLYPVIGKQREEVADVHIQKLLKDNKTKKITVIGQFAKDIPTLLKEGSIFGSYLEEDSVVGEYKEKSILINSLRINNNLDKEKAIQSLKVNALLDVIMIHHRDWADAESTGLGFDKIDMLVIRKDLAQNKTYMRMLKRYRRKGLIDKIKII
jgi:D-alanine-D-alanine ligase-like ATP-grasp enzyme